MHYIQFRHWWCSAAFVAFYSYSLVVEIIFPSIEAIFECPLQSNCLTKLLIILLTYLQLWLMGSTAFTLCQN